jgi:hypothetical protein
MNLESGFLFILCYRVVLFSLNILCVSAINSTLEFRLVYSVAKENGYFYFLRSWFNR